MSRAATGQRDGGLDGAAGAWLVNLVALIGPDAATSAIVARARGLTLRSWNGRGIVRTGTTRSRNPTSYEHLTDAISKSICCRYTPERR
jgi:hypothetical protein